LNLGPLQSLTEKGDALNLLAKISAMQRLVGSRRGKHAVRCAELAIAASTPQLKAGFLQLSKNWKNLHSKSPSVRLNGFLSLPIRKK
jgi:hypothetical protein